MTKPSLPSTADCLHSSGGFVWYYLDLVCPGGDGMVLIWSQGLPFLPGARSEPVALHRPALALSVFQRGRQTLHWLQAGDRPPRTFEEGGSGELFGAQFSVTHGEEGLRLSARLRQRLPGASSPLEVELELQADPGAGADARLSLRPEHLWKLLALGASARVRISADDFDCQLEGRAYLDTNQAITALHRQGIARWTWARLSGGSYDFVIYRLEGQPGFERVLVFENSQLKADYAEPQLKCRGRGLGLYGLSAFRRVEFEGPSFTLQLEPGSCLEDGPFYQRRLARGLYLEPGQEPLPLEGTYEEIRPGRLDLAALRPLVRMRVYEEERPNSLFLPLFVGPRRGRWTRFLRTLGRTFGLGRSQREEQFL